MKARVVAALVVAALSSVVASCRDTLAPTDLTPVPKLEEQRPRQTVAGEWAPEPGACTRTVTAADSGGALEFTGCFLEPQSVNSITIDGLLTAAPSPRSTCCIVTTYPESGTYGPMGGTHSMWMQLLVQMRLIESGTLSTRVVTGSSFGSPASSVTITDVYETGSRGRAVWFERKPMDISVSCGGNPPAAPCPHNGYKAWKYRVSGTQTVTVRRMAKTLQVNVSPVGTIYEGDTVTFTARSSDNRPVTVVRDWIWRDSTGTPSFVPCYSTVCRWVPPNGGIMYVYAKVGTNPFFEQASARVDVVPLELAVRVDTNPTVQNNAVYFTASSTPGTRPVKDFRITYSAGLDSVRCDSISFCGAGAAYSDSVKMSARVNGRLKTRSIYLSVTPCAAPLMGIRPANPNPFLSSTPLTREPPSPRASLTGTDWTFAGPSSGPFDAPPSNCDGGSAWSYWAHNYMLDYAFKGNQCPAVVNKLKGFSLATDIAYQGYSEDHVTRHAMRTPTRDAASAKQLINAFIQERIVAANAAFRNGLWDAGLNALAQAMHAIMDRTSPAHTDLVGNPRIWPVPAGESRDHSPVWWKGRENTLDLINNPAVLSAVKTELVAAMTNAWSSLTPPPCAVFAN